MLSYIILGIRILNILKNIKNISKFKRIWNLFFDKHHTYLNIRCQSCFKSNFCHKTLLCLRQVLSKQKIKMQCVTPQKFPRKERLKNKYIKSYYFLHSLMSILTPKHITLLMSSLIVYNRLCLLRMLVLKVKECVQIISIQMFCRRFNYLAH